MGSESETAENIKEEAEAFLDGTDIEPLPNDDILNEIQVRFSNLGFEVIQEKDMRDIKKEYFSKYRKSVFIELSSTSFYGEVETWNVNSEEPAKCIKDFAEQLIWLNSQNDISDLRLILTGFAEEDYSSDTMIEVKATDILKSIGAMSIYYYDIWADNLIIQII